MLQNLRDNLKGTVAVFVIIIFVVPLVLFGVEQVFVGSAGQKDVAEVNGAGITSVDFRRQLELERQRMIQQGNFDIDSPQVQDDALRMPVINQMVRRLALRQAAENAGMGVSRDALWRDIASVEAFQVDGEFDYELFKRRISNMYTPTQYLETLSTEFMIGQLNDGLAGSNFVTESELALIAGISRQQRDFYTITVPEPDVDVEIVQADIESFYRDNQARFTQPESVQVEYLEISVDALAESHEPPEEAVREAYEAEIRDFEPDPKYSIAHILLEKNAKESQKVDEVQKKINANEDFAALARQYSTDLGSRESGGELGELNSDIFPDAFVEAASALEVGEVSAPVETDEGIHFIKILDIRDQVPPTFEERRPSLARQIGRTMAQDEYIKKVAELDELTFGNTDLETVAQRLGIPLQKSEFFTRDSGDGLASESRVREAAFADDVLKDRYNSRVIELPEERAIVLHVTEHRPEHVTALETLEAEIRDELVSIRKREQAEAAALLAQTRIGRGDDPALIAEESGFEFAEHKDVQRDQFDIDMLVMQKAFSLPRPAEQQPVVLDVTEMIAGGFAVVGLTNVKDGSPDQLSEEQKRSIEAQLRFQSGQAEMLAFEKSVMERSKVRMPE